MDSQEIERYLLDLGDELETRGFQNPVRIMIVGGVYMLLMVKNRKSTEDVDVVLMDMEDTTNKTPQTRAFQAAVRAVDDVAYFIREMAPEPEAKLWQKYKQLHVYLPAKEYIFALKLMVFRLKDVNDVEALRKELGITTREQAQAIVDRFVPDPRWQEEYQLEDTLDEIF